VIPFTTKFVPECIYAKHMTNSFSSLFLLLLVSLKSPIYQHLILNHSKILNALPCFIVVNSSSLTVILCALTITIHLSHCYILCFREVLLNEKEGMYERYAALFALRNEGGDAAVNAIVSCLDAKSALLKHEVRV
jgi:hypothetical protein